MPNDEPAPALLSVEQKLVAVLNDAVENPKRYFLTALELEAMLFALVHLYANTQERSKRLTDAFHDLRSTELGRYGGFCRSRLKNFSPTMDDVQSDDLFAVVTDAYAHIIAKLVLSE